MVAHHPVVHVQSICTRGEQQWQRLVEEDEATVCTCAALTLSCEPLVICKHITVGPQELLVVVEEVNYSKRGSNRAACMERYKYNIALKAQSSVVEL